MQRTFDNAGQLRPVAARRHPQQLRQPDIANHGQPGKLRFGRQPTQLGLIDDGVARLLSQQQLQGLTLQRYALQIEVGVIAA
ncbi:hypothetical protein D3C78_929180 [compost metagenome]